MEGRDRTSGSGCTKIDVKPISKSEQNDARPYQLDISADLVDIDPSSNARESFGEDEWEQE